MTKKPDAAPASVVPTGILKQLKVSQLAPSRNNPRQLFDDEAMTDLRENIRQHGVLVPITVHEIKGKKDKYSILDGERRYRSCVQIQKEEGREILLPANIVAPPTKVAGLLYMFSIHNLREQWELMPTALGLKSIMAELGESDPKKLSSLTGLSMPQIERCFKLLGFPEKFQKMSLELDPKARIPSNFWIELYPVIEVTQKELPDLAKKLGREGLIDKFVDKYQAKAIKSVIHFRRIMEAFDLSEGDKPRRTAVVHRLREYVTNTPVETRSAFDEFITDPKRIQNAISACDDFIRNIDKLKIDHAVDRDDLIQAFRKVRDFAQQMLDRLAGGDAPIPIDDGEDDE